MNKEKLDYIDNSSRSTLKALCLIVLAKRDQIIDIQNGLLKGPGNLWNLFKRFDYTQEYQKLRVLHEKMDLIADRLYEMRYSINQKDSLLVDMHAVLSSYLGAVIETLNILERNTAGLADIAKSYNNRSYTFSDSNRDRKAINESTEKYVKIGAVLEDLYHQL